MNLKKLIMKTLFSFLTKLNYQTVSNYFNQHFFSFLEEAMSYDDSDLLSDLLHTINSMFTMHVQSGGNQDELISLFEDPDGFFEFLYESKVSEIPEVSAAAILLDTLFPEQ